MAAIYRVSYWFRSFIYRAKATDTALVGGYLYDDYLTLDYLDT